MSKKIICLLLCILAIASTLTVSAAPNKSYTHQENQSGIKETVFSRDVYTASKRINATALGINKLSGITDMYCADDNTVYLLCGGESRLIVLNGNYEFVREISVHDEEGYPYNFNGAEGVYVNNSGAIYIANTLNSEVITVNQNGEVTDKLETPKSDIIPEDFFFQPTKVLEDDQGYFYVLSLGCYYGVLLYSKDREFLGFYGANEVESTVLDTLSNLWKLLTSNDEKKSKQVKNLPYTVIDVVLDSEGYVYTCTGRGKSGSLSKGQLRKISPGGSNILYSRDLDGTASSSSGFNFLESKIAGRRGFEREQNIVAMEVNKQGYIFALESTYGKIYVYDRDCNLVTVFGGGAGSGTQLGTFVNAVTMTVMNNDVLVADAETGMITVFSPTDFGNTLFKAQSLYFKSDYTAAMPYWEKVLSEDGNSRLAYCGLAKAYYYSGDTEQSVKYAKLGLDYEIYDYIHQENVNNFIKKNFLVLFAAAILIVAGLVVLLLKIRKRETPLIKNAGLHCYTSVMVHPFRAFNDVKYKKLGSVKIASVVMLCYFISVVLKSTVCGFLFNKTTPQSYNVLFTLAQTCGLILLWTVSNWAICSVADGKGKLKDIYVATAYSTTPLIIYNLIYILLSYILTRDSINIIVGLQSVVYIFVFFILCIGIMTVHEYNFPKFVFTAIVTVLLMILIVFIGFMVVILVQQFWNFLYSLFMEVMYR